MPRPRDLVTCLIVLGLLAMLAPALSLASGGGSAGDQQYTDPLAGTHNPTTTSTSSAPAPSTPTAPSTASPAPSPAPATPTATAATATSTDASGTSKALPYTGYAAWEAAALGFVLLAGGLGLRRRAQRR